MSDLRTNLVDSGLPNSGLNPFLPVPALIKEVKEEADQVKTYSLEFQDQHLEGFAPGRFTMVSLPGIGEAPISLSGYDGNGAFQHTIRKAGRVTGVIDGLKQGDKLWIRGAYGRGWPMEELSGMQLLIIGGGIGLAPLRPLVKSVIANRDLYDDVTLLYGAKTPKDLLYTGEFDNWKSHDIDVHLTVDKADESWKHRQGVVTVLFEEIDVEPSKAIALICGPEVMMRFNVLELLKQGFRENHIYVSLERRMDCGVRMCGHCQWGPEYVCQDGPVFPYSEVKGLFGRVA